MENAVVLGAGVAGLAAAIRLKEHGVPRVVVLERAERPGGLAISLHVEALSSDLGPHRLHSEIQEVESFYREVAAGLLFNLTRRSRIRLGGRFLTFPPAIGELLRQPGPRRLAGFAASWARGRLLALAGHFDRSTYDGCMRAAFGSALYEYLLEPYTEKVFKTDPRQLDAEVARVRVSAGSLGKMVRRLFRPGERKGAETTLNQFHYVRGGAEALVNRMADRARALGAEILLSHEAREFEIQGTRLGAVRAHAPDGPRSFPADRVISTICLPDLVEALHRAAPIGPKALQAARSLRFLDMIFALVIVDRDLISGDQWIYFPEPRFPFNRASEAKAFDPGMGPPGRSVLCCEITCRPGQDLWPQTDEAVAESVVASLVETGLFRREEVSRVHVHRVRNAYPVYDLGYGPKLDAILQALAPFENVLTAGRQGLFNHNNMDHSIFMGFRAADCAVLSPRPSQRWLGEQEAFRHFRIVD